MSRTVLLYAHWEWLETPLLIGSLQVGSIRGKESVAFAYEKNWLESTDAILLDPELEHFEGFQYPSDSKRLNFGLFLDSSPDRWGRMLMQRREAQQARREGRAEKHLMDSDYLLGVHDAQRLGGLRFRLDSQGPFVSDDPKRAAPPWTALRDLQQASWTVQSEATGAKLDDSLAMLIAPGSSLGGARPKAGVLDEKQHLWIAKFPGRSDQRDISAWEMVANRLAKQSGLSVCEAKLESFGNKHRTFLAKRFDRVNIAGDRKRVHFASAMTLLGHNDGSNYSTGASYLDLATWIIQNQKDVDVDLEELWRRIVFSIAIRNTDDHLRNHGFLLTKDGWRLSPAFDLNPDPQGIGLSLNIDSSNNALDIDLVRSVARLFRIDSHRADQIIDQVRDAVWNWRQIATELQISRMQQNSMARAFSALTVGHK
jgi:serine/threonine-protein kinase HipA